MSQPTRDRAHSSRIGLARTLLVLGVFAAIGCSKPPAESPKADSGEPNEVSTPEPGKDPDQATIAIGPKIAELCGISDTETFFGYNSSKLTSSADGVLQKLATCFTTGPAAGMSMSLIGHTDPRGDEEYNMTLGGRRADSVKSALSKKGLPVAQMQSTSRGEMEASGTDEASWSKDRKVEITLVD